MPPTLTIPTFMFTICSVMPDGTQPLANAQDAAVGTASARPLAERQVEALGELVGIGLKIARAIERQVDAAGDGPQAIAELAAASVAFARVARAVRQTMMLQSKLQEGRSAAASRAGDLRARVGRIVRRAIEDEHGETEQAERLAAEAAERLEQERYGDVLTRPVSEIVAGICRDLGLDPDWRGLSSEIAAAEAVVQGAAGGAARDAGPGAGEDQPEYVDVCWIGHDGEPYPVARMRTTPNPPGPDPSKDPKFRRDSS